MRVAKGRWAKGLVAAVGLGTVWGGAAGAEGFPTSGPGIMLSIHATPLHGHAGPYFSPGNWVMPAGEPIRLTVVNRDDGVSPLPAESQDIRVIGTVHSVEWVNGKKVVGVPADRLSHTLTIPDLHLNLPIPAAPPHGAVIVTAWVHVNQVGRFAWYCAAPCGSGVGGWGGAMARPGYMQGQVTVLRPLAQVHQARRTEMS